MSTEQILKERGKTHGDFDQNAAIAQDIKTIIRNGPNWGLMAPPHKEALDMIAHKIGRIMAGDWTHQDHWDDIAGYAKLAAQKNQEMLKEISEKSAFMQAMEAGNRFDQ